MREYHRLNDRPTRNVTSLNNRFADLSIHSISMTPELFTINQVALGFINAMKTQSIEDCDEHMSTYTFIDTEYEDDPIRIRIHSVAGSPVRHFSILPLPVPGCFLSRETWCGANRPFLHFTTHCIPEGCYATQMCVCRREC